MIQYIPEQDDPTEFDKIGLTYLKERYIHIIQDIKRDLSSHSFFQSEVLNKDFLNLINWDYLSRYLFCGFSFADAIGYPLEKLKNVWIDYSRFRIIPILAFNDAMQLSLKKEKKKSILQK